MRSAPRLSLLLLIALILLSALSLLAGKVWISPTQALSGDVAGTVVMALRGPRVVLAIIIGGGLAMAGAALQGRVMMADFDPALLHCGGPTIVRALDRLTQIRQGVR